MTPDLFEIVGRMANPRAAARGQGIGFFLVFLMVALPWLCQEIQWWHCEWSLKRKMRGRKK